MVGKLPQGWIEVKFEKDATGWEGECGYLLIARPQAPPALGSVYPILLHLNRPLVSSIQRALRKQVCQGGAVMIMSGLEVEYMNMTLALLVLFVAAMIGLGVASMRRTRSLNDFFLAGRSIGPWLSAIAYGTSYFSAVLFIGFAGKLGWGFGAHALWISAGNVLFGSLLAWLVLGRRTRRMSQNLDVMIICDQR